MPWYPDWLVALDECAKSNDGVRPWGGGIVRPQHARDIIEQLTALKRENEQLKRGALVFPERDVTSGAPSGDPPSR